MCLGGSHPRKQWPADRFLEIARWLIDTYDAQILLVGSAVDRNYSKLFKELGDRVIDSTGKTTLRENSCFTKTLSIICGQ